MQDVSDTSRLFSTDIVATGLGLLGLLCLLGLLLAGALAPRLAQAQTPTTTIQNGNADTRLQLNYDGGLYVPGTYLEDGTENDSIPAEGAGTRMMWYPAKAAFRAGRVGFLKDGTQWDAANVGPYSVAFGRDTKASGNGAVAIGRGPTASGLDAVSMGSNTEASGSYSAAVGRKTEAAEFYSVAMGNHTVAGTGTSLAFGQCNSTNQSSDNTLLVAGNGTGNATGCDTRSDALVLDQDGNLEVSGSYVLPDGTVLDESGDLGGVSLPFEESVSDNSKAFRVRNTGSGGGFGADVDGGGEAARFAINSSSNSNDNLVLTHRGTGPFISALKVTSIGSNIRFVVDNDGNVSADGTISGGGADVAEAFDVEGATRAYEEGDVLTISTESDRTVTRSQNARSTRVVGVYATKPGVLLSNSGAESLSQGKIPMGVVGVIPTKVSAENGPIERGDLLVTAETPGHAMKAQPKTIKGMKVYPQGAILGKALEAFKGPGTGLIKVMVNVK